MHVSQTVKASPLFSVIVPVYNDGPGLEHCLEALSRQTIGQERFEVVVVDNGSRQSPDALVARYPFARLLHEAAPGSYNARNTGVRPAAGEFLAFTDADCRPHPDWLEQAWQHFRENPQVHAIGGRILIDRPEHPTAAELYELTITFRQQRFVEEEGFAATANLLVRREVFRQVGDFDGRLMSGGDRDWGYRATAAGYRMDYRHSTVVAHPPRANLRALIRKRRRLASGFRLVEARERPRADVTTPVDAQPRGIAMAGFMLRYPARLGLSRSEAVRVLMVAGLLIVAGFLERVRLALGAAPER